jgi:hypothetical protein
MMQTHLQLLNISSRWRLIVLLLLGSSELVRPTFHRSLWIVGSTIATRALWGVEKGANGDSNFRIGTQILNVTF